jgi:hypothetical protein
MSDLVPQFLPEGLTYEISTIIRSYIYELFTANFGIVQAVYGSPPTSVDIVMANQRTMNGQYLNPDQIYNIEVLWPGSSLFKTTCSLSPGDVVLVVGMTSYTDISSSLKAPTNAFGNVADVVDAFTHSLGTAKAIPLVGYTGNETSGISFISNNAKVYNGSTQVVLDGSTGLISMKNATSSLFTVLNGLLTELKNFATTCGTSSTDPTLVSAAGSLLTALSLSTTALSQIMEA